MEATIGVSLYACGDQGHSLAATVAVGSAASFMITGPATKI